MSICLQVCLCTIRKPGALRGQLKGIRSPETRVQKVGSHQMGAGNKARLFCKSFPDVYGYFCNLSWGSRDFVLRLIQGTQRGNTSVNSLL